jgi:hypothetical protein
MARRRPNPEQAREAWNREVRSLLPAASEETLREVIDHCVSESPRGPGPRARTRAGLIRSMAGLLEDPEDDAEERRAEREGLREAARRNRARPVSDVPEPPHTPASEG